MCGDWLNPGNQFFHGPWLPIARNHRPHCSAHAELRRRLHNPGIAITVRRAKPILREACGGKRTGKGRVGEKGRYRGWADPLKKKKRYTQVGRPILLIRRASSVPLKRCEDRALTGVETQTAHCRFIRYKCVGRTCIATDTQTDEI